MSTSSAPALSLMYAICFPLDEFSFPRRIQDLVRGGSDKLPAILSNCFCYFDKSFFHKKKYGKYICVSL